MLVTSQPITSKPIFTNLCESYILLTQQLIVYFTVILIFFIIISTILNNIFNTNSIAKYLFKFTKITTLSLITIIFIFVFLKFNIYIWNFREHTEILQSCYFRRTTVNFNNINVMVNFNGSILSDVIVLLAFSSGTICVYLLGEKNLSKYVSNINYFSMFFIAILIMVYTTNLLVIFISFELLFLPTLYFVYTHGYVERADKTLKILLYWTLGGAFLVLTTLSYLYFKYKTLNFYFLNKIEFSQYECFWLIFCIFIGFGIKVPVIPFHYWLTKIHVEAPAGFSIFLSGFLVKAALYCFFMFNLIINHWLSVYLITIIAFLGIIEASFKMWMQTDFKKLIAYATIQEMNLILYLLIGTQNILDYNLIMFILIHGWLSTLMFFLVDVIQKKTSSRNIFELSGIAYNTPSIRFAIWVILIIFTGFPLTVKFVIEWEILTTLLIVSPNFQILFFFVVAVIGVMGFMKQMAIIMYGMHRRQQEVSLVISKRDKYLFYFISILLIFLNLLTYFVI